MSGAGAGGGPAGKTKLGIFFDLDQTLFIANLESREPWFGGMLGKELWLTYLNNLRDWAEENNIELHVGIVTNKSRFDYLVALAMRTFKDFLDLNHCSFDKDKVSSHVEQDLVQFSNGAKETYLYRVWMQTLGTPRSKEKNKEEKTVSAELICPKTARHLTCFVMREDRSFYEKLEIPSKVAIVSIAVEPLWQEGRVTTKSEAIKKIAADHGIPHENCILIDDQRVNLSDVEIAGMRYVSAEHFAEMINSVEDLSALYDGGSLQEQCLREIKLIQELLTLTALRSLGVKDLKLIKATSRKIVPPIPVMAGGGSAGVLSSVFFRSSSDFYRREPWCSSEGAFGY